MNNYEPRFMTRDLPYPTHFESLLTLIILHGGTILEQIDTNNNNDNNHKNKKENENFNNNNNNDNNNSNSNSNSNKNNENYKSNNNTITMSSSDLSCRSLVEEESCSRDTPSKGFRLKKVIFHEVQIREFDQILGDNPAVSDGVPVALAWEFQEEYNMDIDIYECTRGPERRYSRRKLMISPLKRIQTLIAAGYSPEQIGEAIVNVQMAQTKRLESVSDTGWNGPLDFMNGAVETTGAAFRAINKKSRRGSKILLGSVTAAMGGMKIKIPKRKSISTPAC